MAKSSRTSTAGRASSRSRRVQVPSAWPPASSARARLVLAKRTSAPARMARWREGLGDVGFPDPDRAVEDHRLAGVEPAQRGEVADLRGGQFRGGGEVEPFQGGGLLEPGAAGAAGDGGGLPAGDLVVAEDLEELQVSEFPGAGLGQAGVEGLQHPAELEGAQRAGQGVVVHDRRVDRRAGERWACSCRVAVGRSPSAGGSVTAMRPGCCGGDPGEQLGLASQAARARSA